MNTQLSLPQIKIMRFSFKYIVCKQESQYFSFFLERIFCVHCDSGSILVQIKKSIIEVSKRAGIFEN